MNISDVGKKYDLSPDTLRYYERIGLIPKIYRNSAGVREYNEQDCRWVEAIKFMRNAGMSIELLLEYVEMVHAGDQMAQARKELLMKQRALLIAQIEGLQSTLAQLTHKIESYEQSVQPNEQKLKNATE
ncbi:MerR family transcriptional regulator [Neisseria sp. Ec49-e6-T10]|uniref:MerR family transcriptional regulator n=1 Tax=Neisseria sp. Ec49-e6-T10 TaxID=3140744 RepID=UPI003EC05982